MGYVYLAIIYLTILVFIQEYRICKLKDRCNGIEDSLASVAQLDLEGRKSQIEHNEHVDECVRLMSSFMDKQVEINRKINTNVKTLVKAINEGSKVESED